MRLRGRGNEVKGVRSSHSSSVSDHRDVSCGGHLVQNRSVRELGSTGMPFLSAWLSDCDSGIAPPTHPKESAKMFSAHSNICSVPSEVGRAASANEASTRFIVLVAGSYWYDAVSHEALLGVIGL